MNPVEVDARAHFSIGACRVERQLTTHAEPDRAHPRTARLGTGEQVIDGTAQVLLGVVDLQCHHQLARFVRARGGLAIVEVWRQRDEPGAGKTVQHTLVLREAARGDSLAQEAGV